jgi:dolichyl-phosphate beta-glucosyltransferase
MQKIYISLVIPAYKEEKLIDSTLKNVHSYLSSQSLVDKSEVIVVAADGGDDTALIAKKNSHLFPNFQLIEPGPKVGKGRDVGLGIKAAKGSYVFFTDADLATPIDYLRPALTLLESPGVDLVIGSRRLWKIHKGLMRKIVSVSGNWAVRLLLLRRIQDSQCGFKGFTKEAARNLFSRVTINGWAFDMEILAIAKEHNLNIKEIAIDRWFDPKQEAALVGESSIKASLQTLGELWRIRKQRARGYYEK